MVMSLTFSVKSMRVKITFSYRKWYSGKLTTVGIFKFINNKCLYTDHRMKLDVLEVTYHLQKQDHLIRISNFLRVLMFENINYYLTFRLLNKHSDAYCNISFKRRHLCKIKTQ